MKRRPTSHDRRPADGFTRHDDLDTAEGRQQNRLGRDGAALAEALGLDDRLADSLLAEVGAH